MTIFNEFDSIDRLDRLARDNRKRIKEVHSRELKSTICHNLIMWQRKDENCEQKGVMNTEYIR